MIHDFKSNFDARSSPVGMNQAVSWVSDYETLADQTPLDRLPKEERLWAALERQTANNPHRKLLHSAVRIRRILASGLGSEVSWMATAKAYVIVFLQRLFHWWTPPRLQWVEAAACASAVSDTHALLPCNCFDELCVVLVKAASSIGNIDDFAKFSMNWSYLGGHQRLHVAKC